MVIRLPVACLTFLTAATAVAFGADPAPKATAPGASAAGDVHVLSPFVVTDTQVPKWETDLIGEDWSEFRSAHFTILAETDEKEGQDHIITLQNQLEQFYRGLETTGITVRPTLTIVLFANPLEFARYSPPAVERMDNPPGYIVSGPHTHLLSDTINGATNWMSAAPIVGAPAGMTAYDGSTYNPANDGKKRYHRKPLSIEAEENIAGEKRFQDLIVRWYFGASDLPMPEWLQTGLAEVYGASRLPDAGHDIIGLVQPDDAKILQNGAARQMAKGDGQPVINEAECWLLTHYLLFGQGSGGQGRVVRYVQLLNSPQSAGAFQQAFGMSFAEAEHKAGQYFQSIRTTGYKIDVPAAATTAPAAVDEASKSDLRLALGSLLFFRNPGDAYPLLRSASDQEFRAWEVLGDLALGTRDTHRAEGYFQKAIDAGSTDYLDYYELAMSRVGLLGKPQDGSFSLGIDANPSLKLLRRSIALDPDFQPSYEGMAALVASGTVLPTDVSALDHGLQLAPGNLMLSAGRDIAEIKTGHVDEGRHALDQLLAAHPDQTNLAKSVHGFLVAQ